MKNNKILKRLAIVTLFSILSLTHSFASENMTIKQAEKLLKDTTAAESSITRIIQNSKNQEVQKDANIAEGALGRVSNQLEQYIQNKKAEQPKVSTDIYNGGKKYPGSSKVLIESFDVPVNSSVVHVPVTIDKPSSNTVIAYVRVYNGQGGRAKPDTTKSVIFRPGDSLTKTLSFNVSSMSESNNVRAVQPSVPDGAIRAGGGIRITAKKGAINEPIESISRAPLMFKPLGKLCYSATGETIQFDDKGGPNSFSTSLSHGRTQVGNGETGYYGTTDMGGFIRTTDGLVISSRRLKTPVKVGSPATEYPFLASMLSGHRTPETQFKYGSVEWVVKMPNRFGSWPALWLVPTGGWPPEIDVYEGFGYNGSWKFSSSLSSNIHGGDNNVRTFTRAAMRMDMKTFGLAGTLDSEFHTFAVTVVPQWITIFVDGVETMCYANPFKGEKWYPLTNVAVKAKVESPYSNGSGDMILRSIKVWRAE